MAKREQNQVDAVSVPTRKATTDIVGEQRRIEQFERAKKGSAEVVNGRWQIGKRIGEGGQGRTFRVQDVAATSNRVFVLKRLKSKRPNALQRFAREVEAVKKLKHPGIVSILDHGLPPQAATPFYVMPFMKNGDLNAFANRFRDDAVRVLACFGQIASSPLPSSWTVASTTSRAPPTSTASARCCGSCWLPSARELLFEREKWADSGR